MTPPRGAPRKLSDEQIRKILSWHDARRQFRRRHGTAAALAQRMGVSRYAINWCIGHRQSKFAWSTRRVRLTPRQRRQILTWHHRREDFQRRYGTVALLAQRLGVSPRTVQQCIRRLGRYTQLTAAELPAERARVKARVKSKRADAREDWRVPLLREWLMAAPVVEDSTDGPPSAKALGVKEVTAPAAIGALGCVCVWFLIQSVESHGLTVAGLTADGRSRRWLIPYRHISRLLPAGALQRRLRRGRARLSADQRAALMGPVFGF